MPPNKLDFRTFSFCGCKRINLCCFRLKKIVLICYNSKWKERSCDLQLTCELDPGSWSCSPFPQGFSGGSVVKNLPANAGDAGSDPRLGKIPWRRRWQLTPVFLSGKFSGQKSLVGYTPWDLKELATTAAAAPFLILVGCLPSPVLETVARRSP